MFFVTPPQTHPFVRVDWFTGVEEAYTSLGVAHKTVDAGKNMPSVLLAISRCQCAIFTAWGRKDITLPKDVHKASIYV